MTQNLPFWDEELNKYISQGVKRGECLIFRDTNKYQQVRFVWPNTNISKKYHIHKFVYLMANKKISVPPGYDISHLCHQPGCVNVDHLICESESINGNRQSCNRDKYCKGCHYPPCIF